MTMFASILSPKIVEAKQLLEKSCNDNHMNEDSYNQINQISDLVAGYGSLEQAKMHMLNLVDAQESVKDKDKALQSSIASLIDNLKAKKRFNFDNALSLNMTPSASQTTLQKLKI